MRSEFSPSVIDVGIELDRKMSRMAAPAVPLQPLSRPDEGASLSAEVRLARLAVLTQRCLAGSPRSAVGAADPGSGLGLDPEQDRLASLDWRSVQQLWAAMSPQEQESLGLHNASLSSPGGSTYVS